MYDRETGELSMVSGSRIKTMARVNPRYHVAMRRKIGYPPVIRTVEAPSRRIAARKAGGEKIRGSGTGSLSKRGVTRYRSRSFPAGIDVTSMPLLENSPHTKIYNRVLKIYASKAGMPHKCDAECRRHKHLYVHEFKKSACIWGIPDGKLLIE
jgi:hypothetical protein